MYIEWHKGGIFEMILRSFLPIGQGAFYCEQFMGRFAEERINIIYDCGSSTDVELVKEQIKNNFREGEMIHAVFISHLDEDHINGIPFLLKYCKVNKIFFPLLTEEDARYMSLYNLIKVGERYSFAASFITNPHATLHELDIEYRPRLFQISGDEQVYNNIDAMTIASGENVADIIFGNDSKRYAIYAKWLYVPYNFRQADRIKQLQNELNKSFGKDMDNGDIRDVWEKGTEAEREAIKCAYKKVEGSFNTNSMTLFSGTREHWLLQRRVNINYCVCALRCCNHKDAGCLYTGDYDASGKYKWRDLFEAYKMYWDNVGCIQIPHHGSKYNYNEELSKLDAYFVISAGVWNKYRHPHGLVINDLLLKGKCPYVVTEDECSVVRLVIGA